MSAEDAGASRNLRVVAEEFFQDLEKRIASLSHSEEAILAVQEMVTGRFKRTSERHRVFSLPNAMVREPIYYDAAIAQGLIGSDEDRFSVLQGDIVATEAAFLLGERIEGNAMFAVLNSTRDLVSGRRSFAMLLRVARIQGSEQDKQQALQQLLSFSTRSALFLPQLPTDAEPSLGYTIEFDGIAQIRLDHLVIARRIASLSLAGWRIFGAFARTVVARAGKSEEALRTRLDRAERCVRGEERS